MVKARPLAMEIEENPNPTFAFQPTGGPLSGHSERQPFSEEIPFRVGPRQWGQSFALTHNGASIKKWKSIAPEFRQSVP
jgi:hypothetical protein